MYKGSVVTINIRTEDNINIVGDLFKGSSDKGVLLIHMMPSVRSSYDEFSIRLQEHGYNILTIDLRGHGESAEGPEGYRNFSDSQHQKSEMDVVAAVSYLKEKGSEEICIVGASIGANLALNALLNIPSVVSAVLLSPGFDYKGIKTKEFVGNIPENKSAFFIASKDDFRKSGESNAKMAEELFDACSAIKDIEILENGGHGTDMLDKYADLTDIIIKWIDDKLLTE